MAYPTTTESQNSVLGGGSLDATRVLLALQEQNRARDKVPTPSLGGNWGTSPPTPTVSAASSDGAGQVTAQAGTGTPANTATIVVTFSSAYAAAPRAVLLFPGNATASANAPQFFVDNASLAAGSFTIKCNVAPTASATYVFNYWVIP